MWARLSIFPFSLIVVSEVFFFFFLAETVYWYFIPILK